jgi:hypothetical protein
MENNHTSIERMLSTPTLSGVTKASRQIRETITLNPSSWVGFKDGLILVDNARYNPRYYDLIPSNQTQREVIEKALKTLFPIHPKTQTPKQVSTTHTIDFELKQLESLTSLCKKLNTYHTRQDKLKNEKDENKTELLRRTQQKEKALILKHLSTLKQDPFFTIQGVKAYYQGQYVQASKVINLGGF